AGAGEKEVGPSRAGEEKESGEKKPRDEDVLVDMTLVKSNPHKIYPQIYFALKRVLKEWEQSLEDRPDAIKRSTQGKIAAATMQTSADYLKPLFKSLRKRDLAPDVLAAIAEITHNMQKREYMLANDAYIRLSIGNAPWPIGVTMVGIHERSGREKIFSNNVAHVLNDETSRKYIQSLKRLTRRVELIETSRPPTSSFPPGAPLQPPHNRSTSSRRTSSTKSNAKASSSTVHCTWERISMHSLLKGVLTSLSFYQGHTSHSSPPESPATSPSPSQEESPQPSIHYHEASISPVYLYALPEELPLPTLGEETFPFAATAPSNFFPLPPAESSRRSSLPISTRRLGGPPLHISVPPSPFANLFDLPEVIDSPTQSTSAESVREHENAINIIDAGKANYGPISSLPTALEEYIKLKIPDVFHPALPSPSQSEDFRLPPAVSTAGHLFTRRKVVKEPHFRESPVRLPTHPTYTKFVM
ncbi:pre-mRNA-splicing factor 18, partial [Phenoliferia sp. Uapishka_3]